MNGLFTGSEGTLGFVTEATLKLAHIPEETGVGVATFATMRDAAKAAIQVIHQGIPVGAVEILDDVQMDVINRMGGTGREWKVLPTLFFKFSGTHVGVMDDINGVCRIVQAHGGSDFEFEHDKTKQIALWSARKEALWSMMCLRTSGNEVWSTDVAVPLSKVPDLVGKLASRCPSPLDDSNMLRRNLQKGSPGVGSLWKHAGPYRGWQLSRNHSFQRRQGARNGDQVRTRYGPPGT